MITSITYECTHFLIFLSISPCLAALLTFNEDSHVPPTGLVPSAHPFPLEVAFFYSKRVKSWHHDFIDMKIEKEIINPLTPKYCKYYSRYSILYVRDT